MAHDLTIGNEPDACVNGAVKQAWRYHPALEKCSRELTYLEVLIEVCPYEIREIMLPVKAGLCLQQEHQDGFHFIVSLLFIAVFFKKELLLRA